MMTKKHAAAALAAISLSAFTALSAFAAQVSADSAKALVLKDAGVKADEISYINVERDFENGTEIFDIEFLTKDFREFDYDVRVSDGAILQKDFEAEYNFYVSIPKKERKVSVSVDKAKEIALSHAGKKANEVKALQAKTDYEDGRVHYDVSFYDANWKEYDYEISAYTGEVLSFETEGSDRKQSAGANTSASSSKKEISLEDAKAKALKKAGLSEAQVRGLKIKADMDDGRKVYEGSFKSGSTEYEFEIDAASGSFIEWDAEIDD